MRLPLLLTTLLVFSTALSQDLSKVYPVIDSLYKAYADKNHIPGLAYGIVANGRLAHTRFFGYINLKEKLAPDERSVYRIASMSKSFTAMAILSLRDAGKLQLDDPVSKYIPEMAATKPLTNDAPPISIRHLLTHGAGFPEDNPWGDRQLQRTDEELLAFLRKGVSLSNDPNAAYEYSNLGFTLLGRIITVVAGEPYQQYITRTILQPLGMTHTYFEYTKVPAKDLAHGYRWIDGQHKEEALLHDGSYGAMGGMLTSIEDFSKYMLFHLSAANGPVKHSTLTEMQQPGRISGFFPQAKNAAGAPCPRVSAYNCGLVWTKDCSGYAYIGHSGGLPGFGSNWGVLPDYGIGIVSFCNLTYAGAAALNLQAATLLINEAHIPAKLPAISPILKQRQQQLTVLLPDWKNAEASGIFAENFFDDNPIDMLRQQTTGLFAKAGRINKVDDIVPENQLRGAYRIIGENATLEIHFTLSPENPALIQAFSIKQLF